MKLKLLAIASLPVLAGMSLLSVFGAARVGMDEPPLYERLGGESGIAVMVDAFLADVADDERLRARFDRTSMGSLRRFLIGRVCEATDGPCDSGGSGMPEAYKGVGVTEDEFSHMTQIFAHAMIDAGVEPHEHYAAMHLFADMHYDIVRR